MIRPKSDSPSLLVKQPPDSEELSLIICLVTANRVSCGPVFFLGGGETPPQESVTPPPKIFTDFIIIHPEPPTPRLLPPPGSFNSPPKGEILQETLAKYHLTKAVSYNVMSLVQTISEVACLQVACLQVPR